MTDVVDLTRSSPPRIRAVIGKPPSMALRKAIASGQPDRLRETLYTLCQELPDAARMAAALLLVSDDMVQRKRKRKRKPNSNLREQDRRANIKNGDDPAKSRDEDHEEDDDDEDEDDKEDEENNNREDEGVQNKRKSQETGNNSSAGVVLNGHKRMRSRFAMCKDCEKEFDVTQNGPWDCEFHDGLLKVDMQGDFWADCDESEEICHDCIDSREMQEEYPERYKWDCCGQENETQGCKIGRHIEKKYHPQNIGDYNRKSPFVVLAPRIRIRSVKV